MKLFKLLIAFIFFLINQNADAQVVNAGVGGNTSKDLLARVQQDVVAQKPNLAIMMVGTNDVINSKKLLSYDAYRQNLNSIINVLKENKITVVLVSPPPVDTVYVFERHTRAVFTELPNDKIKSISNIIQEVAKEHKLQFIDLNGAFLAAGLPKHNVDDIIRNEQNSGKRDGVHLTPKGYRFMASFIFDQLVLNKQFKKKGKIVCFGDSITKGVYVAPSENYPAVLLELVRN